MNKELVNQINHFSLRKWSYWSNSGEYSLTIEPFKNWYLISVIEDELFDGHPSYFMITPEDFENFKRKLVKIMRHWKYLYVGNRGNLCEHAQFEMILSKEWELSETYTYIDHKIRCWGAICCESKLIHKIEKALQCYVG